MMLSRQHVLAAALFALVPFAHGQTAAAESAADEKAMAEYRLSMPAIQKLLAATRAMAKVAEDPAIQALAEKHRKSENSGDEYRGLNAIARDMEKFPPMANAIRSAGLTPREYMLISMTYMQAAMVSGLKKQGLLKEVPKGTNPENVTFLEKNEAELNSIQKEFSVLQQKMKRAEKSRAAAEEAEEQEDEEPAEEPAEQPATPKPRKR